VGKELQVVEKGSERNPIVLSKKDLRLQDCKILIECCVLLGDSSGIGFGVLQKLELW
jgi:hypothetical protein